VLVRGLLLFCVSVVGALPAWILRGWEGTEGRRVQIALEMLRSGEWMVPTLGGQPTWAKPPLHYWILGGIFEWLGCDTWTARLPAVLLTFAAAFTAMELLRPWFGHRAGWTAALGIVLSPLVLSEWPSAEIDPAFACLTAMSLWLLATGVARERRGLVLASGLLAGLAFLQKGPPFFLFAAGAYLVWWRHRRLRFAVLHFASMLVVVAAYFVPLWTCFVAPAAMLEIAGEESVGRIAFLQWNHVVAIPGFWLRAVAVQAPFVFWCFWEWRGARDARMDAADVTLRMCSGAAVSAVMLLTFFPGRPTRYLLPNVLLFTFAVAPAVAHYAMQATGLGPMARTLVRGAGAVGAIALLVLPFVPAAGPPALAAAAAIAVGATLVRTPHHVVAFSLLGPLVIAWTVGLDLARSRPDHRRAQEPAGRVLRHELDRLGVGAALGMHGHVEAPLLLSAGLLPEGDESGRSQPTAPWVIAEASQGRSPLPPGYVERLRLCLPAKTFVVSERASAPR
jgi:4-amino-4-deoxy-L-arabinose transferase-like glycosyltransferase